MKKEMKLQDGILVFACGGKEVFRMRAEELLGFSHSFPWELRPIIGCQSTKANGKIYVSGFNSENSVQAEAVLCQKDDGFRISVLFRNISGRLLKNCAMQAGIPLRGISGENVTIPQNLYNDNPSADPARVVPHIGKNGGLIVEEHRLPIPGVNVEWKRGGKTCFATLFSIPETGDHSDEAYWSLGAVKIPDGIRIQSLSGPTMFNGMKDMVYAGKNAPVPFERGYKLMEPDQVVRKAYILRFGCGIPEGGGFTDLVDGGYEIFRPQNTPKLSAKAVVALKTDCMDSRWHEDDRSSGYLTFGKANGFGNKSCRPEYYLYGWTGQSLKLAWCDFKIGLRDGNRGRMERAIRAVDFYARNGESAAVGGMRAGYYLTEAGVWKGAGWDDDSNYSSRIQGEGISDLLDFMFLMRETGKPVPQEWEEAVKRACAFLMDPAHQTDEGLYPLQWRGDGTPAYTDRNSSGVSCVTALTKAYEYFREKSYLCYAEQKLRLYYQYQAADMKHPFCRATMDARCEDKEAGISFFLAAFKLYRVTEKEEYRDWTELAGRWILTFVYFWDTGFKKGSYYDKKGFITTGWPCVSVQNHHLDVFFPCYEMYRFGKITGNRMFADMGKQIFRAFSHGICTQKGEWGFDVPGEQSEQFYPTNFFMSTYPGLLEWISQWRSGIRIWNPSWIIAQVLTGGIRFLEEKAGAAAGQGPKTACPD